MTLPYTISEKSDRISRYARYPLDPPLAWINFLRSSKQPSQVNSLPKHKSFFCLHGVDDKGVFSRLEV